MTPQELAAVRARAENATPGPWEVWNGCSWRRIGRQQSRDNRPVIEPYVSRTDGHPDLIGPNLKYDLEFIAAARADIPALLDHIDAQAAEIAALRAKVEEVERERDDLAKLVYVPGRSKCAKCNLSLVSTTLNLVDGTMGANTSPKECPNGCGPMWRVTEREERKNAYAQHEVEFDARRAAEARVRVLEEALTFYEKVERYLYDFDGVPAEENPGRMERGADIRSDGGSRARAALKGA